VSDPQFVPVIGIVGGVGSGKSALARRLAASGDGPGGKFVVIDGDEVGHHVLREPQVKEEIRNRFGDSVFDERGEVIRSALGRRVFGPAAAHREARTELEKIVHPRIGTAFAEQIAAARASGDVTAVLLDAAVLLEAGWKDQCDAVVFVDAPDRHRLERVAAGRGWNEEELRKRESSQLPLEAKRHAADYVVENSGSLDEAAARLERVVSQIHRGGRP
jgi:dephospho-CoA kinase